MMRLTCACLALAAAVCAGTARAQPATKRVLTLAEAKQAIAAAEAEAARNGWPSVIAVVDDEGWLIAMERMDHPAMMSSIELAPGKARAAALYRKPTAELEKAIDGGRVAAVTAPFVQMQGGVPLVLGGELVGAIGVSTDTPAHDEQVAEAGAKALRP
ncbi:MAG: heme-binding protein [Acetobacteraceae bacterium]|nr:heme-binding protein [Acetobacteraceae bacterium]